MKKLKSLLLIISISIALFSCKKEYVKGNTTANEEELIEQFTIDIDKTSEQFTIDESSIKINWTAYKTTAKVPVKGEFTSVKINKNSAATAKEFLNNLEFSIPVSSIFSNNEERDGKLQKFFFGVMKDTELLSGSISITNEAEGIIHLNMNGITHNLPVRYESNENGTAIKGILNLENWKVQNAIESLNKACFDLHKGDDGVSKTWNTVNIYISFTEIK